MKNNSGSGRSFSFKLIVLCFLLLFSQKHSAVNIKEALTLSDSTTFKVKSDNTNCVTFDKTKELEFPTVEPKENSLFTKKCALTTLFEHSKLDEVQKKAYKSAEAFLKINSKTNFQKDKLESKPSKVNFEIHRFWLTLSQNTISLGQTLIGYATGATDGLDANFDAAYFNDSPVALISMLNNEEYIIQGRALPFLNTDVVPLGFKTNSAGTYKITLSSFDGLFAGSQLIFLKDNTTGFFHNLKSTPYTFSSASGVFPQRFEIHYISDTTTFENGVWDNGIPTHQLRSLIKSNFTLLSGTQLEAKSLTLSSGIFTVKSGATLNVLNEIKNNTDANQFIIESDATVLQNTSVANEGLCTVIRNSALLFRHDYTLWSSPVLGQNLRNFSPLTLFNRFYTYNTAGLSQNNNPIGEYEQELFTTSDIATKIFQSAKGYLIRMPNNWNLNGVDPAAPFSGTFKGVLQNGTISIALSQANSKLNLVGNPYPSPISINTFFFENPNIERILYFWRKTNGNPGSGYITHSDLGTNGPVQIQNIQTGQGFFVKTNTASVLNFTNSMRVNSGITTFFKSSTDELTTNHRFWLRLLHDSEEVGQTLIGYKSGATLGIDSGVDAAYYNDSPMALNSLIGEGEFSIQGRGLPFQNTDTVNLAFKTNSPGNFKIELANFDGLFSDDQAIFLKDHVVNAVHNLKQSGYTFTSPVGVFNNRFEIQYNSTLGTNQPVLESNNILVSVKNQQININAGKVEMEKVELIDVSGRVIFTLENLNATNVVLDKVGTSHQALIVRITTNGYGVKNKKIIF